MKRFYLVSDINGYPHKITNYVAPIPVTATREFVVNPLPPQPLPVYPFVVPKKAIVPIIKLGPMISQNIPGTVKIISENNIFTLNIPINNMRQVTDYIYTHAFNNIDPTKPKVTFRIITPTLDTQIQTTMDKMLDIVKGINQYFPTVTYVPQNQGQNNQANMAVLISLLNDIVESKKNYVPL